MTGADIAPGIPGTLRPSAAGWRYERDGREWLLAGPQWPGTFVYHVRIFADRVRMLAEGVVSLRCGPSVAELVRQAPEDVRAELRRDGWYAILQIEAHVRDCLLSEPVEPTAGFVPTPSVPPSGDAEHVVRAAGLHLLPANPTREERDVFLDDLELCCEGEDDAARTAVRGLVVARLEGLGVASAAALVDAALSAGPTQFGESISGPARPSPENWGNDSHLDDETDAAIARLIERRGGKAFRGDDGQIHAAGLSSRARREIADYVRRRRGRSAS